MLGLKGSLDCHDSSSHNISCPQGFFGLLRVARLIKRDLYSFDLVRLDDNNLITRFLFQNNCLFSSMITLLPLVLILSEVIMMSYEYLHRRFNSLNLDC